MSEQFQPFQPEYRPTFPLQDLTVDQIIALAIDVNDAWEPQFDEGETSDDYEKINESLQIFEADLAQLVYLDPDKGVEVIARLLDGTGDSGAAENDENAMYARRTSAAAALPYLSASPAYRRNWSDEKYERLYEFWDEALFLHGHDVGAVTRGILQKGFDDKLISSIELLRIIQHAQELVVDYKLDKVVRDQRRQSQLRHT